MKFDFSISTFVLPNIIDNLFSMAIQKCFIASYFIDNTSTTFGIFLSN